MYYSEQKNIRTYLRSLGIDISIVPLKAGSLEYFFLLCIYSSYEYEAL